MFPCVQRVSASAFLKGFHDPNSPCLATGWPRLAGRLRWQRLHACSDADAGADPGPNPDANANANANADPDPDPDPGANAAAA